MSVKKIDCQLSAEKYPSRENSYCNSFSASHGQNCKQHLKEGTISYSNVIGSFAKNLHKKPFQIFVGSSDFSPKEYDIKRINAFSKA